MHFAALERMQNVGGDGDRLHFHTRAGPRFGKRGCWAYKLAKHPDEERALNLNFL